MSRRAARVAIAALLLALFAACGRARVPSPRSPSAVPSRTPTALAVTTAEPQPTAVPTESPTPAGRLPSVLARISVSLPEGDAYNPHAAAFDEAGRAVVLCYYQGMPSVPASALIVVDPAQATRGKALALPGQTLSAVAAAAGRAYVGYQDAQYNKHLAAVALDSGRIAADVPAEGLYLIDGLAADASGHLYTLGIGRLEVREQATLQAMRSVPLPADPGPRVLALEGAGGRLYVAAGTRLMAFRAPDLTLLWEAPPLPGEIRGLTVDRAGERVYARWERYEGSSVVAHIAAFAGAGGQPLPPVASPAGTMWSLIAADSQAGLLTFAEPATDTRLWQTGLDGMSTLSETTVSGYAQVYSSGQHLLALDAGTHRVHILDASLQPLGQVFTGVEIRNLVVDAGAQRAYLNDSTGRLHVVDGKTNRLQATLDGAGTGMLTLDAANNLLFVGRVPLGREVAVVDTAQLTVTAVITGGYQVAVDSAGRRAFVGYTATGPDPAGATGEVQVWDTRTFRRLGAIAHRGEPAYNPLRDEVYLRDYTAYVVDGRTLALTGELTPDIGGEPLKWCNGCRMVQRITVHPEQDLIVIGIIDLSAGKGPGTMPQPRVLSAGTREPVTHTATVLTSLWGEEGPFILPPDEGRVYVAQRYARYVFMQSAVAYEAGAFEPSDFRDGLGLDLYLPGRHVALDLQESAILAYDPRTWEPLGWMAHYPIRYLDPAGRKLYAWERSLLTVLSFDGGEPLPQPPPEPWPGSRPPQMVQEIHFSPGFAHDGTVLVAAANQLRRSTDGGASWLLLPGPIPPPGAYAANYHLALSPNYPQDHTLFLGGGLANSLGLGVWRSADGGETWAPLWRGLTYLLTNRLAVSPQYAEDRTLLAYARYQLFWRGQSGEAIFRSTDGGATWTQAATRDSSSNAPPLPPPEELLPYPEQAVQFKLGNYGQELLRSGDGGRTWRPVLQPGQPGLMAPVRSPAFDRDGQVFVMTVSALYRSVDTGLTWEVATDPRAMRGPGVLFTALAVGLGADGQPMLALGDSDGALLIVPAGDLRWQQLATLPPTPAAIPSPTPCAADMPQLGSWPQDLLGCPEGAPEEVYMAWQPFERGVMFWLSDRREVYVLYSDLEANRWRVFPDTWEEGQPDRDATLQPPPDREQPIRGFGRVWREELGGPESVVGWAMAGEWGYTGQRQAYTGGLVFTAPDGQAYAFLEDGTWLGP